MQIYLTLHDTVPKHKCRSISSLEHAIVAPWNPRVFRAHVGCDELLKYSRLFKDGRIVREDLETKSLRCWFDNLGLLIFVKLTLFFPLRRYIFCYLTTSLTVTYGYPHPDTRIRCCEVRNLPHVSVCTSRFTTVRGH